MEANTINNEVEEKDSIACPNGEMKESDDQKKNIMLKTPCPKAATKDEEEESMELVTPRTKMGFNDMDNTLKFFGFTQYVQHQNRRCC